MKLDARTGKESWRVEISPFDQQYFSSMAPIIIGDHVIVGTGNDLDAPGFLQSYDPETGKRQWILYTVPMNPGDPGLETWPSLDAARHGGAQPGCPASTIRRPISTSSAPAIRRRRTRRPGAAKASGCSPARWSR